MKPRILFLITEDWYYWSHRRSIAVAAEKAGFEVIIATRIHNHRSLIQKDGFKLIPIRLRRSSRNPIKELLAIMDLFAIYRRERPSIVHHVSIKPVLYGSWVAALVGVPAIVNALAGLGHVYAAQGWRASLLKRLVSLAYRTALRFKNSRLIFQNSEDQETFVKNGIVTSDRAVLIRGAGVDLVKFRFRRESEKIPVVMLAGRLLWNKGVGRLVEAANLLKLHGIHCRVVLVGTPDPESPQSVSEGILLRWQKQGAVEWWGRHEDMPEVLAQANLVVLPTTYGEGVPKILLEAAAVGRAVIATDIPGCREIVRHGQNGLLIPPGDVFALASAIGELLKDPERRARMGRRGREIVEAEFSEQRVVTETLAIYRELLHKWAPRSSKPDAKL